jgi:hypothetical protein
MSKSPFYQPAFSVSPAYLSTKRVEELEEFQRMAAWHKKNPDDVCPSTMKAMEGIARELAILQDKVASLIESGSALVQLMEKLEDENLGQGDTFTESDADVLVNTAALPVVQWQY